METPPLGQNTVQAFKIFYAASDYTGYTYADWKAAPIADIQGVAVLMTTPDSPVAEEYACYGQKYYALNTSLRFTHSTRRLADVSGHVLSGGVLSADQKNDLEKRNFDRHDYGLQGETDHQRINSERGRS